MTFFLSQYCMWLGFRTLKAILASKSASNKLATLVVANPFFDFALTKNSNWILVRGGSHNPKSQKALLQTSFCGFFKFNNPVHICSKITKAKALYIRPGEIFWREKYQTSHGVTNWKEPFYHVTRATKVF